MPGVDSLDELNEKIRGWDATDDGRRINDRIRTVGQDFAVESPLPLPTPDEEFDPGLSLEPRDDRSALITVRMAEYSVPARFLGKQVRVSLRASEVVVFDGRTVIARHQRVVTQGGHSLDLDRYLEVLRTKPGGAPGQGAGPGQRRALPGASALAAARRNGTFTAAHDAFWAAARKTDGDAGGTRQLIDVLPLHRTIDTDDIIAGIEAALTVGAVTDDVVAVEARRHSSSKIDAGGSGSHPHRVARRGSGEQRDVSLTQRRLADPAAVIAGLPADSRPLLSVDRYDQLLRLPTRATTHSTEGTGT